MPARRPVKGFTLIELLSTMAIIAVLVVGALLYVVSYVHAALG